MPPKINIVVCSGRDWKCSFGASLCGLVHRTSRLDGIITNLSIMQGSGIVRAREQAIASSLDKGFTHVLFLDDDMVFPSTLLEELLAHDKDIVGINYARKEPGNRTLLTFAKDGTPITSAGKEGVEEIGWLGFGGVLVRLEAVKDIELPLFEIRWIPERKDYLGEDFYFCMKAQSHGLQIYIDHNLSNKCGHVGDFVYREQV